MADTIGCLWGITRGIQKALRGHVSLDGVKHDLYMQEFEGTYDPHQTDSPDFFCMNPVFGRLWKKTSGKGTEYLVGHIGPLAVKIFKSRYKTLPEHPDWNITRDDDQSAHPREKAPPRYGRPANPGTVDPFVQEYINSLHGIADDPSMSWDEKLRRVRDNMRNATQAAGWVWEPAYESTQEPIVSTPTGPRIFSSYELQKFREFGLTSPYTLDHAKEVWREGAKRAHPDRGGTHEAFIALKSLYSEVERILNI